MNELNDWNLVTIFQNYYRKPIPDYVKMYLFQLCIRIFQLIMESFHFKKKLLKNM